METVVTIVVETVEVVAIVAETDVVEVSIAVTTVAEIAEVVTIGAEIAEVVSNAETTVAAETVVVEDSSNVTTEAETAEVATVEEATKAATTIAHPVENIVGAMIADPLDVIPENLADGGPKARAAPAGAEISLGAFI